jgi:mannosyltransferase
MLARVARAPAGLWVLLALVAAGAALRFATLGVQSYWYDEAVTVDLLRHGLIGMLRRIPNSESTPPLYYVLAWLWSKPFGSGEVGVRSLSALCGTCAIPAAYAAAAELTTRRIGLVVAALAAFNPLLIWYSQEARSYALVALLTALSLYAFARLLRRPSRGALYLWGASAALALATHYFAAFVVGPEAMWLLARRRRAATGVAVAAVALVALALLPLALHQRALDLASFIRTASLPYRLPQAGKQYLTGFDAPLEIPLSIAAAAIVVAGAALALRRPSAGVRTALVLGAVAVAVPFLLAAVGADYFDARNLIVAWVPLATVTAAGLARGPAGLCGVGALCAIGLTSYVGVLDHPLWQRDDWRGIAASLGPPSVPRAVVLTPGPSGRLPFELYRPDARALPGRGARVRQIALVSTEGRTIHQRHPPPPPRPSPAPGKAGFVLATRVYAPSYTVIALAATKPEYVTPRDLAPFRLLPREIPAVLLERPRPLAGVRAGRPPAG